MKQNKISFDEWAWGWWKPHSAVERIDAWNERHAHLRRFEVTEPYKMVLGEMIQIYRDELEAGRIPDRGEYDRDSYHG